MQNYSSIPQGYPVPYMYAQPTNAPPNGIYAPPLGPAPYQLTRPQGQSRFDAMRGPPSNQYSSGPVIPPSSIPLTATGSSDSRMPRNRRRTADRVDRTKPDQSKRPLKSAMKKPSPSRDLLTVPTIGEDGLYRRPSEKPRKDVPVPGVARVRTISDPNRPLANSFSRARSRSQTRRHFTPNHLFLQFGGTNKLRITSVMYQDTVDTIRERVLAMWPEGVIYQTYRNEVYEFHVQFSGNPWTAKGALGLMAMKMILELFSVLARQGYICISSIDMAHIAQAPRLVFTLKEPDPAAKFFMMTFSSNRRKIKIINQDDQEYCQTLSQLLRETYPRKVSNANWDESDVYHIEISRLDSEQTTEMVLASILQHSNMGGFKLEGTIPFSPLSFWGFLHGRKEAWVFKQLQARS